ncbi:MAG: hypothetical protein KF819_33965 [Labilithrix sp.]|nr:hypothetical protein [Labilithrix sp.]
MNKSCDTCGNSYDKSFEVRRGDRVFTFDSLECAAQILAPLCSHCSCRILGHGIEVSGTMYCCAHCARHEGKEGARDRVG